MLQSAINPLLFPVLFLDQGSGANDNANGAAEDVAELRDVED